MSSIFLVRRGDLWMHQLHGIYDRFDESIDCADIFSCRHIAETAAKGSGGEVVEFREERGHERAYNYAIDCVDRVFQSGGQPEPPLLPDFCTLGDDKFLAVIRLARNYLDVKRSLAAAEDEIARLRHKLKTAEK